MLSIKKLVTLGLLLMLGSSLFAFASNNEKSIFYFEVTSGNSDDYYLLGAQVMLTKIINLNGVEDIDCLTQSSDLCAIGTLTDLDGTAQLSLPKMQVNTKYEVEISAEGFLSKKVMLDSSKEKQVQVVDLELDQVAKTDRIKNEKRLKKLTKEMKNEIKQNGGAEAVLDLMKKDKKFRDYFMNKYKEIMDDFFPNF